MAKEIIRFKGLSLNRDEQATDKGELSLCAGVELHDGALRPSILKGSKVQHSRGGITYDSDFTVKTSEGKAVTTLLYVHETASYRHFIGQYEGSLYWFRQNGMVGSAEDDNSIHTPITTFDAGDTVISVNSVGNTLVVMATSGIHYILWSDTDYKYLGTQIPFVDISFRPSCSYKGEYSRSTMPEATYPNRSWYAFRTIYVEAGDVLELENNIAKVKEGKEELVTEAVWALINQANYNVTKDGHFYAPFLVRYCYRLYDGRMVMHSAPVYMNVSFRRAYRVYCSNIWGNPNEWNLDDRVDVELDRNVFTTQGFTLMYKPVNVEISYMLDSDDHNLKELKNNWSDIVESIDIFVSPMLPRERQNEKITKFDWTTGGEGIRDDAIEYLGILSGNYPPYDVIKANIPIMSDEEYMNTIKNNSSFYKVKSLNIKTDTIGTGSGWVYLNCDKDAVMNITAQEQMTDDYHTHHDLIPISKDSGMYIYNHRLNLYKMNERLYDGFYLRTMMMLTSINNSANTHGMVNVEAIYVEISTEHGKRYVGRTVGGGGYEYNICKTLLFYPDSRATKMIIHYKVGQTPYEAVLPMEPHNFLNASVVTSLFYLDTLPRNARSTYHIISRDVPLLNKVITSEADNPYYFPLEGRNSVGTGSIIGLASVTRALSQGQVGDHDLIVFATDGIWVMKVSGEGTYTMAHNISREVCTNPKSICQLDQSVVFATQRSLSRFVESNVISMSDMLDGPEHDWQHELPTLWDSFETGSVIRSLMAFSTPAVEMFNKGKVFYDYASARVLVLPEHPETDHTAMVFSTRDQTWSTMPVPAIKAVVPGYPSPYVQQGDGKVIILDKTYDYSNSVTTVPGIIITRELTFSESMDVMRGFCHYSDSAEAPRLFIFGSNDQRTWIPVGNTNKWFHNYMPGKPFRFFRIAVYMQMKPSEEYQQLMVEFVNKYAKL